MLLTEEKLAYICEIAFGIWASDYKNSMDNILAEYTALDFDYDCYPDFYEAVLIYSDAKKTQSTLLQCIYDTIDNKEELMKLRDMFLSTYKK